MANFKLFLLLLYYLVFTQCMRELHIVPESRFQQICPGQCYSLQDVFSNRSYFFRSNTSLRLLPGKYEISENIGDFTVTNVNNLTISGSSRLSWIRRDYSNADASIHCQPNVTFGFVFINCSNVVISNLSISHCSAKLGRNTIEAIYRIPQVRTFNLPYIREWTNNMTSCEVMALPCVANIVAIECTSIKLYRTVIFRAQGTAFLSTYNKNVKIEKVIFEYNQFNCIIVTLAAVNLITESRFKFGHKTDIHLSSGLSILIPPEIDFLKYNGEIPEIHLASVELLNNDALFGNFYIYNDGGINKLIILNVTSISDPSQSPSGIIVDSYTTINYITMNDSYFEGNCVNLSCGDVFYIIISNVTVNKSNCPFALTVSIDFFCSYDGLVHFRCPEQFIMRNVNISESYHNTLYLDYINMINISDSNFGGNEGTVLVSRSKVEFRRVLFCKNKASNYPSILFINDSSIVFLREKVTFSDNNGHKGGAMSVYNSQLSFENVTSNFNNNVANSSGGAIYMQGSSAYVTLGIIQIFKANNAKYGSGGGIYLKNSSLNFYRLIGRETSSRYSALNNDALSMSIDSEIVFEANIAMDYGGAIHADNSIVFVSGRMNLESNEAHYGGAVSLTRGSFLTTNNKQSTHIVIAENSAKRLGGGIFVDSTCYDNNNQNCFLQPYHINTINTCKVMFSNNTALSAGSALYGGWIDTCEQDNLTFCTLSFHPMQYDISPISSDPTQVCLCIDSQPNKNITSKDVEMYPGQTLEIEAVAVGQRYGVAPAIVRAENVKREFDLIDDIQKLQDVGKKCTTLRYTFHSPNKNEQLLLTIDMNYSPNVERERFMNKFFINIRLKLCSLGFKFDRTYNICVCHPLLKQHQVKCNVKSHSVNRKSGQWISADFNDPEAIVVHNHCPFDYCKAEDTFLNLSTPDDQCTYHRSGILCGKCQFGYSQMLGTSKCMKCSNVWLILTLLFAVVGIVLVVCLMMLNLTVSAGTINGVIFYANIVRAKDSTFFPGSAANTFMNWFVAWLNLDFGIESCYFNGLDAIAKTWMQFVFPLYIWIIVVAIIISSHYSTSISKIYAKNILRVLATLFLMSYSKLLRVVIFIFKPSTIDQKIVWGYDGNIDYLDKQHTALLIIALLFLLILIPFTLITFGIQWLQIVSHYKPLFWVNKLKPLFDAYTGPYKDNHRYWTGLLLFVRIILFIVFSSHTGGPAINLLAVIVTISCLFVHLSFYGGIYKLRLLNLLEYSFLLNLMILTAGTLYMYTTNKNTNALSQTAVSIAFIQFVCIIIYHMILKLKAVKCKSRVNNQLEQEAVIDNSITALPEVKNKMTHSSIELREPLIGL